MFASSLQSCSFIPAFSFISVRTIDSGFRFSGTRLHVSPVFFSHGETERKASFKQFYNDKVNKIWQARPYAPYVLGERRIKEAIFSFPSWSELDFDFEPSTFHVFHIFLFCSHFFVLAGCTWGRKLHPPTGIKPAYFSKNFILYQVKVNFSLSHSKH